MDYINCPEVATVSLAIHQGCSQVLSSNSKIASTIVMEKTNRWWLCISAKYDATKAFIK